MPNVVLDASALVGALIKPGSIPEQALLLARTRGVVCLSFAVEAELREVFARPRFRRYLADERGARMLDLIVAGARWFEPQEVVVDCRDAKDNKYLELASAAAAGIIVSSDRDLQVLDPWRGIRIVSPADYVRAMEPAG